MSAPHQMLLAVGSAANPPDANTKFLGHFDGANGATSFTDASSSAQTVTAQGGAALSTTDAMFGSACSLTDNNGDYWVVGSSLSYWNFLHDKATPWTFEGWFKPSDFAAERILIDTCDGTSTQRGIFISITAARNVTVFIMRGVSSSFVLNASFAAAYPNDTANYHHLAITYDPALGSNNCTCWIDGTSVGSVSQTANAAGVGNTPFALRIGTFGNNANTLPGRYDEIRISDVIRYTGTFTPTGPLN